VAPITIADFQRVDIRLGTIVAAEPFPEARRPAYRLRIDLGPELGIKQSSARVTELYAIEALIGRQVAAVVNLPPLRVGSFVSEVLVLGFPSATGAVSLVTVEPPAPNGGRLY